MANFVGDTARDQLLERPLPNSAESERAILGAIILDNALINQAIELLKPEDFYVPSHRRIFVAMIALFEHGAEINPILISEELRRDGALESAGGLTFITNLMVGLPHFTNIAHYAKVVRDKSLLRQLVKAANKITSEALEEEDEAEIILDHAEQLIFALADERTRQGFAHVKPVADQLLEKVQEMAGRSAMLTGLTTGFNDLDAMTSGLQPSDLIVIAARPSMGKCLAYDSEIVLSDGSVATIEQVYRSRSAELLTLNDNLRFNPTRPSDFIDDGVKPVFHVRTRLGRSVECTLLHPFLTIDGWQPLQQLKVGSKIAVPRILNVFGESEMRECEVKLLAYLIGDGCLTDNSPVFTVGKPALQEDFELAVLEFGGVETKSANSENRTFALRIRKVKECIGRDNPVTMWLKQLGLYGCDSHAKFIPSEVFKLRRDLIALFLNRLFATDGWASVLSGGQAQLGFASVSHRLAQQIQHLLLRFGIIASLKQHSVKYKDERRIAWQLDISDARSIHTFINEIGIHGKEAALTAVRQTLADRRYQTNRDLIPVQVWEQIAMLKGSESWASLARRTGLIGSTNIHVGRRAPQRERSLALGTALNSAGLTQLATSVLYWDEIVAIEPIGPKQVYDLTIPETHNFVANDICVHYTSLCLTLAQNAAIQAQAVVGVFSLEMSKESLVMRMLCSEGRVDAHRFRSGFLSRDEWARLAGALGTLADVKIFIDDTPGISVLEMRAKARRLAAEQKKLDLIIVDYLQLMSGSSRRAESRQQEVSQISRELKGLAKELNVPLIALSQLSRAPENRTDHRPQLADLRECIVGDSIITDPETGQRHTVADLYTRQQQVRVFTLDHRLKIVKSAPAKIVQSGEKEVFLVRTASGREIRASANHPFLTINGWQRLDALALGTEIGVPRCYPRIGMDESLPPDRARLLGYLVSDGSYAKDRVVSFISNDPATLEDARRICREQFGFEPRDKAHWSGTPQLEFSVRGQYGPGRNPLVQWLKQIGIHGDTTVHKRVPDPVFHSSPEVVGEFLANSDIYWDQVVEVTPAGYEMTYDLMVPGTHNFVVDDIIVHNSGAIEQDSDVVAFIYREEQYNRTEENAGIAEIIVAKQRNGPTGMVKLAFLKEFTRFENMWRE